MKATVNCYFKEYWKRGAKKKCIGLLGLGLNLLLVAYNFVY